METAFRTAAVLFFVSGSLFAQVQIRTAPPQVDQSSGTPRIAPLDRKASIHLSDVAFREFLDEVSRQTKLEFILLEDLDKCRIAASVDELDARSILQMTIEFGGMTYQSAGRSNRYVIARRKGGPHCPPPIIKRIAPGPCKKLNSPAISFECSSNALGSLAELLNKQSGASVMVWNRSVQYPVSLTMKNATFEEVVEKLQQNRSLRVKQLKGKKYLSISLESENSENNFVEPSRLHASERVKELHGPHREEPTANPSYKHP